MRAGRDRDDRGRALTSQGKHGFREEHTMSTEMNMAKKAVHDKIASQIDSVQATLETLKAKAEAAKANAELKVIADLLTQKQAIDHKLSQMKTSSDAAYQQAKSDVESRVAELEKSVRAIQAKFKAA
jgi:phage shock protein A